MKFWGTILSQPTRSVLYVLKKFDIEYEFIETRIPQDTRSEDFRKNVNPEGTVPVIEHEGEKFYQSGAILRYLIDTFKNDHTLLPSHDKLARAKIEQLLDRNGNTLRKNLAGYVFDCILAPKFLNAPLPSAEVIQARLESAHQTLAELNGYLADHSFLVGEYITIADIQIYNEVLNFINLSGVAIDEYKRLSKWKENIETDLTISEIKVQFDERLEMLKAMFAGSPPAQTEASAEEIKEVVVNELNTAESVYKENEETQETGMLEPCKVKMPYRVLGNSGLHVSAFTFGTWLTAANPDDEANVIECVKAAYRGGITTFDTAEAYGFGIAEKVLGKALKELDWDRSDLVIITKIFKVSSTGMNDRFMSKKHIVESLQESLKRLQLDYVDIIFSHRPDYETPIAETWRAFDWLIEEGLAFYWATSEWPAAMIAQAIEYWETNDLHKPIADQCEYSAMVRDNAEETLRSVYESYSYGTTIWSPLVGGLLTGKYNTLEPPEGSRYKDDPVAANALWPKYINQFGREGLIDRLQGLARLAEEVGCTQAQLCLAWVLVNKDITTTIIGASKVSQIESNLKSLEIASKWTPELEEKMSNLLDNSPSTAMDFNTFSPMKSRRSLRIDYSIGK